jgi:hypothetical protein
VRAFQTTGMSVRGLLAVLALVLMGVTGLGLAAFLGSTPVMVYAPPPTRAGSPNDWGGQLTTAQEAARVVGHFVRTTGQLPPPGTGLDGRSQALRWMAPAGAVAPRIVAATVQQVRLRAAASVLEAILDDDPIYTAEVDVRVTTADGRETALRFILWDYGRLLPWGLSASGPRGDGLKPRHVQWRVAP